MFWFFLSRTFALFCFTSTQEHSHTLPYSLNQFNESAEIFFIALRNSRLHNITYQKRIWWINKEIAEAWDVEIIIDNKQTARKTNCAYYCVLMLINRCRVWVAFKRNANVDVTLNDEQRSCVNFSAGRRHKRFIKLFFALVFYVHTGSPNDMRKRYETKVFLLKNEWNESPHRALNPHKLKCEISYFCPRIDFYSHFWVLSFVAMSAWAFVSLSRRGLQNVLTIHC